MLCPPTTQRKDVFKALAPLNVQRAWQASFAMICLLPGLSMAQSAGHAQLQEGARAWLAAQQRISADALQATPLDPRLHIPACTQNIQYDLPFGNRQSVRARCDQPSWQHFIQVMARPDATPAAQANTATTPAPTVAKVNPGMVMRPVLVANQAIKRGTLVSPQQFTVVEMALPAGESTYLSDASGLVHMELQRDLPAQTPLRSYDLKAAQMVRRGQQVMVSVGEGKGFLITLRAEAQQDGVMGEQIRLKNTESGRSLTAVITGLNAARAL